MTFVVSGIETGTLVTTLVTPFIAMYLGWEWVFYFFGAIGIVWSLVFALTTNERPVEEEGTEEVDEFVTTASDNDYNVQDTVEHAQFYSSTRHVITTYASMACTPAVWAIIVAHTCYNYGWYVIISWLPGYMKALGVSTSMLGVFTVLPYLLGLISSNVSGVIADLLIQRVGIGLTRKLMMVIAFFGMCVFQKCKQNKIFRFFSVLCSDSLFSW